MTPSQPTDDRSRRHQSRWSITSNAAGRNNALESTPRAAPNRIRRTTTPAHSSLHLRRIADHLLRLRRATLLHSHTAAKSP